MALTELFGANYGLTVGVQGRKISGITNLTITGVSVHQSGNDASKTIIISFFVDGSQYELTLEFWDETYQARNLVGGTKNADKI